jgi:hypothetical protein
MSFREHWCKFWHRDLMYFGGDYYTCRICGLKWSVAWGGIFNKKTSESSSKEMG